ncbi:hypothetical protein C4552_03015 [Candidatus Parcubacteria bacterium]|nr:MAG: hypothetical protein C4552_03015 [Candidatus Parcubacteria bacterium]
MVDQQEHAAGERASIRKNRWFFWAVVIATLNPIFGGIIVGLLMLSEPDLRKEGRVVTVFACAWGLIALMLLARFSPSLS